MIENELTDLNELLLVLMEECAEVQVEASKIMRFPSNNCQQLEKELGDLYAMINILQEWDLVSWDNIEYQSLRKREKLKQFSHFMGDGYE